jgi:hypothetical protein
LTESCGDAQHDDLIARAPFSSVRQASGYASALRLYGHAPDIYRDPSGEFGALLSRRRFPIGGTRIHTSGGLAIANPRDVEGFRRFLDGLVDHARGRRAAVLEVNLRAPRRRFAARLAKHDPGLDRGIAIEETLRLEGALEEAGFVHVRERGTHLISLERESDEALLESFNGVTCRNVRLAKKRGVVVEQRYDAAAFDLFERAYLAMTSRKGLGSPPERLVKEVLYRFCERRQGGLFVASFEGVPRNYLFVSSIGEPAFDWGAVASAARDDRCPPTGQLLHYAAMCFYRAAGKTSYDFGGSPGPIPIPGHENYGVWRFKYGFHPEYVAFSGLWRRTLRRFDATIQSWALQTRGLWSRHGRDG